MKSKIDSEIQVTLIGMGKMSKIIATRAVSSGMVTGKQLVFSNGRIASQEKRETFMTLFPSCRAESFLSTGERP